MPEYEKPGPPKGHAYGAAAVTQALDGLDFPANKDQVLDYAKQKGSEDIYWTKDEKINLKVLFDRMPNEEFESMAGVVSAISGAEHNAKEEGKM